MHLNLHFLSFPTDKPNDSEEGNPFLLYRGGRLWDVAHWGAERQMFFWDKSGDYIEDDEISWARLN